MKLTFRDDGPILKKAMEKSSNRLFVKTCGIAFIASWLLIGCTTTRMEPQPSETTATVKNVAGTATYFEITGATGPVGKGMKFGSGIRLTTSPASTVLLELANHNQRILIKPDSTCQIAELGKNSKGIGRAVLNIERGGTTLDFKKKATEFICELRTPVSTTEISNALISAYSDGAIVAYRGNVVVNYNVNGKPSPPSRVNSGQFATPPDEAGGNPKVSLVPMVVY